MNQQTRAASMKERPANVLSRLHQAAKGDRSVFLGSIPSALGAVIRGKSMFSGVAPRLKNAYMPVSQEMGEFLRITALSLSARTIVEFGSSFGLSAIYLSSALGKGGRFIGTEMEPNKVIQARKNLEDAGLSSVAEIREGDARETLKDISGPIDLVFLDGWKDLYLPMVEMLRSKLRPGAIVAADNIYTFKKALAPYVAFMQNPENGFASTTLPFSSGMEYSVFMNRTE